MTSTDRLLIDLARYSCPITFGGVDGRYEAVANKGGVLVAVGIGRTPNLALAMLQRELKRATDVVLRRVELRQLSEQRREMKRHG